MIGQAQTLSAFQIVSDLAVRNNSLSARRETSFLGREWERTVLENPSRTVNYRQSVAAVFAPNPASSSILT